MFSPSRRRAQQIAGTLLAGHCGLVAWWTLRHAGVLDAMVKCKQEKGEGLQPLVHATRTNMAPEVLDALLQYLAAAGLVSLRDDGAQLTSEGEALLKHEDGVLEVVRAYQPVLEMAEHLLAKLKSYGTGGPGGVQKKSEYLVESQAKRYADEVFPAIASLVAESRRAHLLDLSCGNGDLLIHIGEKYKNVVAVGISADGWSVRRANDAITARDLDKRLLAIAASPLEVCTETQRTFDRIGVSRQLWKELDCLIAVNLFSEVIGRAGVEKARDEVHRVLSALVRNFPGATLILAEPVLSPRLAKNYYAAEMTLLWRLARAEPWPVEQWQAVFEESGLALLKQDMLHTEGLGLFLCQRRSASGDSRTAGKPTTSAE